MMVHVSVKLLYSNVYHTEIGRFDRGEIKIQYLKFNHDFNSCNSSRTASRR